MKVLENQIIGRQSLHASQGHYGNQWSSKELNCQARQLFKSLYSELTWFPVFRKCCCFPLKMREKFHFIPVFLPLSWTLFFPNRQIYIYMTEKLNCFISGLSYHSKGKRVKWKQSWKVLVTERKEKKALYPIIGFIPSSFRLRWTWVDVTGHDLWIAIRQLTQTRWVCTNV